MNKIAQKLFHDHKNPIVRLDLIGTKLFFKASTADDEKKVENNQSSLENVLRHSRVERRCARSRAEWCPNVNKAKVIKVVKGLLENFGYQDKNGIFLYPEEILFLLENNRMEVLYNNLPLSLQECYNIFLNIDDYDLRRYMVYKKLVLNGYRVVSYKEMLRKLSSRERQNQNSSEKKCPPQGTLKRKMEDSGVSSETKKMIRDNNISLRIENLFEKMRNNTPKMYSNHSPSRDPEYCVFLPNNKNRTNWDLNVFICEDILPVSSRDKPSVHAVCLDGNVTFLTANNVNLPCLPL